MITRPIKRPNVTGLQAELHPTDPLTIRVHAGTVCLQQPDSTLPVPAADLEIHPDPATSLRETVSRMAIGPAPGGLVLIGVLAFYAFLLALTLGARRPRGPSDEVEGVEKAMDHWKT